MRKDEPNTGVFINRQLVRGAKSLAAARNRTQGDVVDLFVSRLVDAVERGQRLRFEIPEYKRETRDNTTMVLVNKALQKRVKILAAQLDTTARALTRLAIEEGLATEQAHPGLVVPALERRDRQTRAIAHDAELVEALKHLATTRGTTVVGLTDSVLRVVADTPEVLDFDTALVEAARALAAKRGTSVVGLTDALLRVVVETPSVLDAIKLPSVRHVEPSASVEAAAKRVVEKAGPRSSKGGGTTPPRRKLKPGKGRAHAR